MPPEDHLALERTGPAEATIGMVSLPLPGGMPMSIFRSNCFFSPMAGAVSCLRRKIRFLSGIGIRFSSSERRERF